MTRLYDLIRRHARPKSRTLTDPLFKSAVVVSADNVFEYLEETKQYTLKTIATLPCLIPPFASTFVEWKVMKNEGIGWLFQYADLKPKENLHIKTADMTDEVRFAVVGWMYIVSHPDQPHIKAEIWLNSNGMIIPQGDNIYSMSVESDSVFMDIWKTEAQMQEASHTPIISMTVALWTLAFMHTAKVEVEEVAPIAKLSKAHEKKYRVPLCSYKTIKVNAISSKRREAIDGESRQGGKHRLHICRGHWRDYRFGAGLYGKWHGIYWIRGHFKGKEELGTIKHNYEIEGV